MNPLNDVLFNSDVWHSALEKYASAAHLTVQLFAVDEHVVLGPIHETPLFHLFNERGYDPGLFAECARRCLAQTEDRPAIVTSQSHGLAVVGTSLVLLGEVVGAAVAGYALVDFSQLSEIQHMAHQSGVAFDRVWEVARREQPVPQRRLIVNGELLQVLGDALLRENYRTRQSEHIALQLEETARAKERALQAQQILNRALNESEARYRALFDFGPVAVYSCDASGVIDNFNRRAAELWGRTPAQGDTDERFCGSFKMFRSDGSFMPHEQCLMADVVNGRLADVRDQEVLILRPDGSRVTVVVNIRPLTNERGEVTGAVNCFYDITERQEAERVRARLAAIVEFSDDAIISKDLNGTILTWNRGAERLFGYTAQEAIGQPITIVMPADRPNEEPEILGRIRRGESLEHYETVRCRKDGRLLDISLTVSPIVDSYGQIVGASKIARDITDRKRAEEALRENRDNLERTVEERTAALRELSSSLLRAQDDERRRISRELHDSVGQHLASAKMTLESWRRYGVTEQGTFSYENLINSIDKCVTETRTISDLLHPPLLDELGLGSAVSWYVEEFSKRSGIQVNLDMPHALKRFPDALELVLFRVIQESLTNIHRHSRSRSVDILLELDASAVVLQVRDYGRGMPLELLEKFKSGAGGGVGLRSMRERISEAGGRFEIQSDSKGTLIRVAVPLTHAATKSESVVVKGAGV